MSTFRVGGGDDVLSSLPPKEQKHEAPPDHTTKASSRAAGSAQPAATQAPRVRRRNRMITSCLECRRRKLKCDKQHPCSNCSKFARDCLFLAPSLDSASQLKLTEIKEKMGSLERVLEQDVAKNGAWRETRQAQAAGQTTMEEEIEFAPIPEDERGLEPTPLAISDAVYDEDADDELMDLGVSFGKMRLTDRLGGFVRPKISEEVAVTLADTRNDRRSELEKSLSPEPPVAKLPRPENLFAPGPTYLPPASNFFFSANHSSSSLIDYLPAKSAADHLLEQYWHAVHPLCRVVHRPTFQRRYDLFWNEVRMGIEPIGSLQALVFAALFSAVVSMPEDQILNAFAVSKKDLVDNFQQGAETALGSANLLRTTRLETMQAFIMYMIPLCRDQISRAHSALVGTAIRMAECMGLHKDGTAYGMSPVETHVRRMIWYQLGLLDIRTCEAQGPRPGIREGEFDTKFPLNVDDNDLESINPPTESSDQWTDMTLTLIRMECNEMMRTIWFDRPKVERRQMSLMTLLGKIENFRRSAYAKYGLMLDTTVPIKQAASMILGILCNRMQIMVLHRYHNSVSIRIPDRLRQIVITAGTNQTEASMHFETLPAMRSWAWFSGALSQYHTAFLLLAEIFTYPNRREADRIWNVIDYVFEVAPELDRDQKARLILTEIRDRWGAYRDARKVRAPTVMQRRIGGVAPRSQSDIAEIAAMGRGKGNDRRHAGLLATGLPATTVAETSAPNVGKAQYPVSVADDGVASAPPPDLLFPAAGGERRAPLPPAYGAAVGSPENNSLSNPPSISGATQGSSSDGALVDELMADIDWNEWDKLFPPDTNTGDLNMPMPMLDPFGAYRPMG